jgi:hypothetical protein
MVLVYVAGFIFDRVKQKEAFKDGDKGINVPPYFVCREQKGKRCGDIEQNKNIRK